jgi:hypothetical protein
MQNGDVADGMKRMGINYRINFGVSIPELLQLAGQYESDNELAFYMLNKPIRETKILSSLLFDIDKLSEENLLEISRKIEYFELIEQFSKNLFSKSINLLEILNKLIEGNCWQKALALYSASWKIKREKELAYSILQWSEKQINNMADCNSAIEAKGYVFLMQSIVMIDNKKSDLIKVAKALRLSENKKVKQIADDFLLLWSDF